MNDQENIDTHLSPFNHENLMVREWMTAFQQPVPVGLTEPSEETRKLRCSLILEEALEYIKASGCYVTWFEGTKPHIRVGGPPDLVAMFDATLDLKVVVNGAEVAMGITPEQSDEGFCEVMDSNWSKMWTGIEVNNGIGCLSIGFEWTIIEATTNKVWTGKDLATFPYEDIGFRICVEKKYIVQRSDGKTMKSPSYRPADLGSILNKISSAEAE